MASHYHDCRRICPALSWTDYEELLDVNVALQALWHLAKVIIAVLVVVVVVVVVVVMIVVVIVVVVVRFAVVVVIIVVCVI